MMALLAEYRLGTPKVLPRYRSGTGVRGCRGTAQGRACGAVVRRRVPVRCRGQQRVPGGLRVDRDRGGVPHRGRRRG